MPPLYHWRQRLVLDELLADIERHARTTLAEAAEQLCVVDGFGEEIGDPVTAERLLLLKADLLRLRPALEELNLDGWKR
jgi:hypothetical protein